MPAYDQSRYVYQAFESGYSPELAPVQVFDLGHDTPHPAIPTPEAPVPPWLLMWWLVNGIVEQAYPSQYQS